MTLLFDMQPKEFDEDVRGETAGMGRGRGCRQGEKLSLIIFYFWAKELVALCDLISSHTVKWEFEKRGGDESEVKPVSLA